MKKSLLALAVAALAATSFASTASATTVYDKDGTSLAVYGRVQAVYYSDKTGSGTKADNGEVEEGSINASGRLGFDLRSQINPYVAGFAKAEFEMANGNNVNDETDSFDARYLWVGFDFGQFGQVKVGKFEEAIKYAISQTDIFDDWGCTGLSGNDDRREGVVQYQWNGYGVDVIASYAFAKNNEHLDGAYWTGSHYNDAHGDWVGGDAENVDIDYSYSLALGYTSPDVLFGPIAVRVGYLGGEFADPADHSNNVIYENATSWNPNGTPATIDGGIGYDSYDQFAIGLSWGSLNIGPYIAAVYQQRTFDLINDLPASHDDADVDEAKVTGYEFAVGYNFGNGLLVRAGYNHQKYEFGDDEAEGSVIPVYVNYNFNPQVQVWAEARFDAGSDDDDETVVDGKNFYDITNGGYNSAENVFSAGVRYNF